MKESTGIDCFSSSHNIEIDADSMASFESGTRKKTRDLAVKKTKTKKRIDWINLRNNFMENNSVSNNSFWQSIISKIFLIALPDQDV